MPPCTIDIVSARASASARAASPSHAIRGAWHLTRGFQNSRRWLTKSESASADGAAPFPPPPSRHRLHARPAARGLTFVQSTLRSSRPSPSASLSWVLSGLWSRCAPPPRVLLPPLPHLLLSLCNEPPAVHVMSPALSPCSSPLPDVLRAHQERHRRHPLLSHTCVLLHCCITRGPPRSRTPTPPPPPHGD
jgi:hypothetical protein